MVDFSRNCSVMFFFVDGKEELIMMKYERPQFVDDYTLNQEAETNASDMIKKKLNGAKELIAIGIARSEMQRKDIINKVSKGSA